VNYLVDHCETHIKEHNEFFTSISLQLRYNASEIKQEIIFERNSPLIRFNTYVDWRERSDEKVGVHCLRVGFSAEIDNRDVINEIPFGTLRRACKQTEYPQIRFSALEDEMGGFALVNDCKYGIKTGGNLLELTLVRSSYEPDPSADIGYHNFSYAMLPFAGKLTHSDIFKYASQMHSDLWVLPELLLDSSNETFLPFSFRLPQNVSLSAIKRAEANDAYILRFCECFGSRAEFELELVVPSKITEVDILEATVKEKQNLSSVKIAFSPFEIKTIKISDTIRK
jgi:alpha-mannosidase